MYEPTAASVAEVRHVDLLVFLAIQVDLELLLDEVGVEKHGGIWWLFDGEVAPALEDLRAQILAVEVGAAYYPDADYHEGGQQEAEGGFGGDAASARA